MSPGRIAWANANRPPRKYLVRQVELPQTADWTVARAYQCGFGLEWPVER